MEKKMNIFNSRKDNGVLISGHRGAWGGNIIPNTIEAYEAAIQLGSDIIEVDVFQSTDGILYTFHTGEEMGMFGESFSIRNLSSKEINSLCYLNSIHERTGQKVCLFCDVLKAFKRRCYINVDRGWFDWEKVIDTIVDANMEDQIILKSPPQKELLEILQAKAPTLMYMPILHSVEEYDVTLNYKINTISVEIVFSDDLDKLCKKEFINMIHDKGQLIWVNALTINDTKKLSAGHDDNISIIDDPQKGWGHLIDMGADIIQTDWPSLAKQYINTRR